MAPAPASEPLRRGLRSTSVDSLSVWAWLPWQLELDSCSSQVKPSFHAPSCTLEIQATAGATSPCKHS